MRYVGIILAVGAIACSGPTSPRPLAGDWDLLSINGTTLPVIVSQTGSDNTRATSGFLVVRPDGASWVSYEFLHVVTGGATTARSAVDSGSLDVRGLAGSMVSASGQRKSVALLSDLMSIVVHDSTYTYKRSNPCNACEFDLR